MGAFALWTYNTWVALFARSHNSYEYIEEKNMNIPESRTITLLRIGYWIGIILDAVAFVQMAFPSIGLQMLKANIALSNEYVFAINFAAGLMLAWTLLLFWADRIPLERKMVIPLTMIIIIWNICTMIFGVRVNLLPVETLLPQIIMGSLLLIYYAFCMLISFKMKKEHETPSLA